jgi:nitrous oxide reductase
MTRKSKFIASQNSSQYIPIHTNPHGIEITEQGLWIEVNTRVPKQNLKWYICRLEAWFATNMENISLKNWD